MGSRPAAAKVQSVPGGPCQPELFLETMFANFVLIVSLSKLWLPGLREGESLEKSSPWLPSLLLFLSSSSQVAGIRAFPRLPSVDIGPVGVGRREEGTRLSA